MSNAYQEAQRTHGLEGGGVISVGDLFAGALIPGIILVALYAIYIVTIAFFKPSVAPATPWPDGVKASTFIRRTLYAMLPPIFLIFAVLGSILSGYATPTRGAALGAIGAIFLAAYRKAPQGSLTRRAVLMAALGMLALIAIDLTGVDMRFNQTGWSGIERVSVTIALVLAALAMLGTLMSMKPLITDKTLGDVSRSTMHITCMVFVILIGATVFSLVFRGFGGDELVGRFLDMAPGGKWGALALVMLVMFILGFFLDFIEITFVVVPLVAPPLLAMGMDPIWLGILMALNLQTSFLTPPFGFALFYLRGVAPPEVTTPALYRGVIPFIAIQFFVIMLVVLIPELATSLPKAMLN